MTEPLKIITLCGSTRFKSEFERFNRELTLKGHVVIMPACLWAADGETPTPEQRETLDRVYDVKIRFLCVEQSCGKLCLSLPLEPSSLLRFLTPQGRIANFGRLGALRSGATVSEALKPAHKIPPSEPGCDDLSLFRRFLWWCSASMWARATYMPVFSGLS
jgi:hypothetical protein